MLKIQHHLINNLLTWRLTDATTNIFFLLIKKLIFFFLMFDESEKYVNEF